MINRVYFPLRNIIGVLIVFIILYLGISALLLHFDNTPTWGKIVHPKACKAQDTLDFVVQYNYGKERAQIFPAVYYVNDSNRYEGSRRYKNAIKQIYKKGEDRLSLPLSVPDSIKRIKISLSLHEIPFDPKTSIYRSKQLEQKLQSKDIFISDNNGIPQNRKVTFGHLIAKSYTEGKWKVYRGDPTFTGWFITLAYCAAFIFLFWFVRREKIAESQEKHIWITILCIILFLGINKQLDLQMLLADMGRTIAKYYEVYNQRKPFQLRIFSLCISGGLCLLGIFFYTSRKAHKSVYLALSGLSFSFSFIVINMLSHHKLEAIINKRILMIKAGDLMELAGIGIVILSALWFNAYKDRSIY